MTRGFIVTGTDTEIGKSVLCAGLVGLLGAQYWKPVQAGLDDDGWGTRDAERVARLAAVGPDEILPEAYCLTTPCSPHQAAAIDGVSIAVEKLDLPATERLLIVEGAGGVLVPLSDELLYADVFARWHLPVVLTARTALGTISHSLLSIEALRRRSIPILGIAFVGNANPETERVICAIGGVRRLGRLPLLDPLNSETLSVAMQSHFTAGDFL